MSKRICDHNAPVAWKLVNKLCAKAPSDTTAIYATYNDSEAIPAEPDSPRRLLPHVTDNIIAASIRD